MNDILKQRLVGALILVALGVVFWPIIFVEPGEGDGAERPRIPPQPAVETQAIEPPDMAGLRPSAEIHREPEPEAAPKATPKAEAKPAPQQQASAARPRPEPVEPGLAEKPAPQKTEMASRTRKEAPAKPALDSDGVPIAWILRVASVSSSDKAEALRQELLQFDQKAYVKKVKKGDKVLYRVYIGPKFEKASLETLKGSVDARFGVSSMITRYYP